MKIKYDVQAIKKFQRALRNIKQYNIVDPNPLASPDSRKKDSENYITIVPNTPENIQKVRNRFAGVPLQLYGRGPRPYQRHNYYGNHCVPLNMRDNPPYVAIYKKP
jgi:hypothetical protein